MEKISVRDLTFQYPLGDKPAVSGISFDVKESDFVVICGKSGCGKSTLLRHLKKSMAPYGQKEGTVQYDGCLLEDMDDRADAAEIGFVQQNPDNQLVTDKVWHELAFGLENLGMKNEVIKRRVAEMASYFGIDGWFRKNVADLSGGQKQMLNLASIMAMQPKLLVLDEPTSQLDPIAASDFLNTLYKINRDLGTTVIISEHRLEEVFPMADKVLVLDGGKVLTEGLPHEVGIRLYNANETPHPMYHGLPAAMRIFPGDKIKENKLPLSVRQGRLLLTKLLAEKKAAQASAQDQNSKALLGMVNTVVKKNGAPADKLAEKSVDKSAGKSAVITVKSAYFRYEKREKDVVRGLDLTVHENEIFALLGGNGSGKSTTLNLLCGILKVQRGKVQIAEDKKIALVPQNPQALFTELSAEEEIYEGMEPVKVKINYDAHLVMNESSKIQKVKELLTLMEIDHLAKANPYDLSGGEQQRLAIAKVLAYEPDILLLDEPTKGLDPFFKRTLGKILKELTAKGMTIVIVSHDIDFCAEYADRCGLFFDGEIAAVSDARSFFCGNGYYTTTTNKIVREFREDLILCEEARDWLEELL